MPAFKELIPCKQNRGRTVRNDPESSAARIKALAPLALALLLTGCAPMAMQPPSPPLLPIVTPDSPLVQEDVDPMNQELIRAAAAGDSETVQGLLAQGADVHAANDKGVTALIAAAYANHVDVARLLIQAGADINRQDRTQQSAYLISTSDGYLELLRMTLSTGADVHSLDSYNGTGLIRAADRGHVEVIEELLKTNIEHRSRQPPRLDRAAGGCHPGRRWSAAHRGRAPSGGSRGRCQPRRRKRRRSRGTRPRARIQ